MNHRLRCTAVSACVFVVSRAAEKVVNVGGDFSMASTVEQGERPPLAVGIS